MDNIIPLHKRKASRTIGDPDEGQDWRSRGRPYRRRGKNMQTFLFRSRELIVDSDDADLIRDVGLDINKAQTKLAAIQKRLRDERIQSAARLQLLSAAEIKLKAAIVAALLSGQR